MNIYIAVVILSACASLVLSQGPVPQRLQIPGAVPLNRPQFRNDKVIAGPGVVRIRRPLLRPLNALPVSLPQKSQIEEKPVTEEAEDEQETFVPHIVSSPQPNYNQDSISQIHEHAEEPQIQRFSPQERPAPLPVQQRQSSERFGQNDRDITSSQRFNIGQQDKPQQRSQPTRPRPAFRENRPQYEEPEPVQARQRIIESRPHQKLASHDQERERKPVAQILRKYRDENADGTITWGFENDDGSYKEEIIGNDCVTRGRYGYIDPDGLKREYNYETGIKCDPNSRLSVDEEETEKGYVDYQENKAVLPNGVRVDLTKMGKNSRRPQGQFYRN